MNVIRRSRVLLAAALAISAAQAQAPGDVRVALVIGNAHYPEPATLANSAHDARDMADALRGLGFDVQIVQDGRREDMLRAIESARSRLKGKQGIGMLYYAGHGLQLDWRNYMVPVDAKLSRAADVPAQGVDVNAVLDAFRDAASRMNIVVLDACRDNPFKDSTTGKGLAQLDAPPGTLLAYSTAPGNVAEDGNGSNGLYTQHLLHELVKPQSRIEDVFKRTRFAVRRASNGRQIPWESTSLEEDFMFNAGRVVAAPKPDPRAREEAFAREVADWEQVKRAPTVDSLYAFLGKYPSGSYNEVAQLKLAELQKPQVQAQPAADGTSEAVFFDRFREGDRYEIIWRDGLTGNTLSRSSFELRAEGDGFRAVTLAGTPVQERVLRTGHTVQSRFGTFDPPPVQVPGLEFKVGNRASGRSNVVAPDGSKVWIDYEGRIAGRETIDTAFGKLATYRVDSSVISQAGMRIQSSAWYEPAWGFAVRMKTEVRQPNGGAPDIRIREVVAHTRRS